MRLKPDDILAVDSVTRRFKGLVAVDGVSFSVARRSVTALIGPNGAGKTTLFNVITGFLRRDAGTVSFDGESVDGLRPDLRARRGMVRTFQIPRVFRRLTILENLLVADPDQPGENMRSVFRWGAIGRRNRQAAEKARDLLELLNIGHVANDYAGSLSGGQRKLVELGRVLMTDPKLIMLDEPMAGVNPALGERLLERVQFLRDQRGITFLFIEHDMEAVMRNSDRVLVLDQGRLIADGAPESIRQNERVIDAYLGRRYAKRAEAASA